MDDEPSSAWLWYLIGIWVLIVGALFMLGSGYAHAQDRALCGPAAALFPQYSKALKEKIIWEGNVKLDQGMLEFVLFQSEDGIWSLFVVQDGMACLRAEGQNGTPNALGKGV